MLRKLFSGRNEWKLIMCRKAEKGVLGVEGRKMQELVWREIVEVLKKEDPRVGKIVGL